MAEDRALPNLKARLSIDTSDAERAEKAVQQARSGLQGMVTDAKTAGEASRAAAQAQRAEAAAFSASLANTNTAGIAGAGEQAAGATTKLRGLGTAASQTAQAIGGTAGQMSLLGTALSGPGGIAAGAAVGIVELQRLSQSMNDTQLSARQLTELAGKTGQDAAAALVTTNLAAVATRGGFSDLNGQIAQLAQQGDAGIGTLLNMRDALHAAGKDTSAIDTALGQFNTTFLTTGATVQRGAAYMDDLTRSERAAAAAAEALTAATRNQASAGASLLTSQSSVVGAENRLRDARERLANFGTQATGKSIREARDEAAAVEAAGRRIEEAQRRIIDARQKVADAQEKLAHAGEHERLDVNDAQDAVDAALRKLNASTPEERGPAQHALDDARQKLTDAKRALDDAKPDAERALDDALRGVVDAEQGAEDAHRSLMDAQDRMNESTAKAAEKQGDYQTAVDAVTEAQLGLAAAQANQMDLLAQLAGRVDGPVSKLGNLKTALREVADELDPNSELTKRVKYVLATLGGEVTAPLTITLPGQVKRSARGNHLAAFEPSWVGDKFGMDRAELFVPDVPGTVVPTGPFGLDAMAGRGGPQVVHNRDYHINVPADGEPLARAIVREIQREDEREKFLASAGG